MKMYDRLAPFIKEYIYREKWDDLREIQTAACDVIFNTGLNLLLASGTASGKTEAAFLPTLTKLYENPSNSVGILYISPIKTLINDQFARLNGLLEESGIKVTKWHGDSSRSEKSKLLKNPQGIMQTTPESLEAMLMKNKQEAILLFSDLKYIIIDEAHSFMNEDRGIQLLCILERIQKLTNTKPVRIGLSATLSDYDAAEQWLNSGSERGCVTPNVPNPVKRIRISLQHFYVKYKTKSEPEKRLLKDYYKYLYELTFGKKCILFSNSKAEAEQNIAKLRELAKLNRTADVYMVHHAHISSSSREFTEDKMRESEEKQVVAATLTLELGIDIGLLERIVQTGCPMSVSSFVQRLGRSGRRGQPSEMFFVFREELNDYKEKFYEAINWSFLRTLATINLYLEEKWVEPVSPKKYPINVLYHQTMSYIASVGEVKPALLAQNLLSLSPFKNITQEEYKKLLYFMIEKKQLERTEDNGLFIGEAGEIKIGHYGFYSVFDTLDEYIVKCDCEKIGMVQLPFMKGQSFALAGRSWRVREHDEETHTIYVNEMTGAASNKWDGNDGGPIHNKVMKKMKEIIRSDTEISYLSQNAKNRLNEIRKIAKEAKIDSEIIVPIAADIIAVFPFLGKREMMTLNHILNSLSIKNEILMDRNVPFCILVRETTKDEIIKILKDIKYNREDLSDVDIVFDITTNGKYDKFVPEELRKKRYLYDVLDLQSLKQGLEI
ncbi:MAG: box helicase domain protein [Clostridia bacterium]|jgi:ATP-dependent Lhr-like helicase|nr:box helicase domain protein [Clostridia bacterium]